MSTGPGAISAIVIGAGPAGLAASRELSAHGTEHVVLEQGTRVGHVWANLYDGLVLHTGKHLSALPGMPFPAATPLFPTRRDFVAYLERYAERFRVPVVTGAAVANVARNGREWIVTTADGLERRSPAVVVATGIVSNPRLPQIPTHVEFRERVAHSVTYRRPEGYAGLRVLVVGAGNSAGEIAVELADAGARVTIAVRSGARVVPRQLLGLPIQYFAVALAPLPSWLRRAVESLVTNVGRTVRGHSPLPHKPADPCAAVPLIGFHLVEAIKSGSIRLKGGVTEFTVDGARFDDGSVEQFDRALLATGYRAALQPLSGVISTDRCGFAVRRARVESSEQPGLYFVGHNYDTRGGLRNIAMDARLTGRAVARQLT